MRAVQDVAAGAGSDAGEADNVDNDEVIRSYYAAVEKLGPLHCGFAIKRKDNEYELVGGNTRYLFLSEYFMKQAPLPEAYTHGWVHVVPNEEDATVIAEGHNKVAACVRPPPTPQHDADIIYKRLTPLLDGERPRHDFVKEAVPGSQRNLAARLRKVVTLAHDDDDGGMEGEHKSTVMHLLLRAISEHSPRWAPPLPPS
ncbi:hypothetical protein RI054_26g110980 [Pseudoscourfieldia marina]